MCAHTHPHTGTQAHVRIQHLPQGLNTEKWQWHGRKYTRANRGREKRQQTRRERKRTSGRQERLCGLPFSPSGAMVTCRAGAQHREGTNVSPNQDKIIAQKVLKVVWKWGHKVHELRSLRWYFKGSDRTKWQRDQCWFWLQWILQGWTGLRHPNYLL